MHLVVSIVNIMSDFSILLIDLCPPPFLKLSYSVRMLCNAMGRCEASGRPAISL